MNEMDTKMLLNIETKQGAEFSNNVNRKCEDDENIWWASESTSSTGSYSPDSSSSIADWEAEISATGEVFYIESYPDFIVVNEKLPENENQFKSSQFSRRKNTSGRFMRFIKQRESSRCSTRNKTHQNVSSNLEKAQSKNKNSSVKNIMRNKTYEVTLTVDPEKKQNLGRRASKCEAYLGIIPGISSDGTKVVVTGFVPQGEAIKSCIKEGDYLQRINSTNVTFENLNSILLNIVSPTDVLLEFQRITINKTENFPTMNTPTQSPLVKHIVDQGKCKSHMENMSKDSFGIMFVKATNLAEVVPESQDILYTFPKVEDVMQETLLSVTRGAFVTLNHMITDILGPNSISSTILCKKQKVYVSYTAREDHLLLISLPSSCCNEHQAEQINADIVRMLEFTYGNLTQCFTLSENHSSLNHLLFLICQRIQLKKSTDSSNDAADSCNFETILSAAQLIRLPKEAHIQIDSALNEMEAMDYRDWNEDPMNCQRLYTAIGSCLYHKSYLIGSHLPHDNLIKVNSFLRNYGLLNLVTNESLKALIIWKKVYPSLPAEEFINTKASTFPQNQYFLLIVGFKHDLLAVIFESGGCTAKIEGNVGPNPFYVEEAQETLQHIQKIGITTLAEKWILVNTMVDALNKEQTSLKSSTSIAENIFGFIKSSDMQTSSDKTNSISSCKKMHEILSTKQHNSEENTMASGSVYSLQASDDSQSQGTGVVSEMSDEAVPILGRRAIREKINIALKYSEDSDSDVDIYKNEKQGNSMDISSIRDSLLCEAEYISSHVLTVGEGSYSLHYLHLDLGEGILISSFSDKCVAKNSEVISKFSNCIQTMHTLLQNTLRYRKIVNQDAEKSVVNKSLASTKEYGTLFVLNNQTYWVVGRILPHPREKEVYVCYQDSTPQNLVEMTFRLNAIN